MTPAWRCKQCKRYKGVTSPSYLTVSPSGVSTTSAGASEMPREPKVSASDSFTWQHRNVHLQPVVDLQPLQARAERSRLLSNIHGQLCGNITELCAHQSEREAAFEGQAKALVQGRGTGLGAGQDDFGGSIGVFELLEGCGALQSCNEGV
jgi:hypothetical protein